jgi:hypothetical protein
MKPTHRKPSTNLWPLGIIVAFALFIIGTVALIVIACSNSMDLVSTDYYEQEIHYQTRLDQLSRTRKLGAQASVAYLPGAQRITVNLPASHLRADLVGEVLLYRPSAAGLDRTIKLRLDSNGVQHIDAANLSGGLWKVRVLWAVGKQEYFIDQTMMIVNSHVAHSRYLPFGMVDTAPKNLNARR